MTIYNIYKHKIIRTIDYVKVRSRIYEVKRYMIAYYNFPLTTTQYLTVDNNALCKSNQ